MFSLNFMMIFPIMTLASIVTAQRWHVFRPPDFNNVFNIKRKPAPMEVSPFEMTPASCAQRLTDDVSKCKSELTRLTNTVKTVRAKTLDPVHKRSIHEDSCPEPVAPRNGHVVYSGTTSGVKASIICDNNYSYIGNNREGTCTTKGEWVSHTESHGECYKSSWKQLNGDFHIAVPYDLTLGTQFTVRGKCTETERFQILFEDTETGTKILVVDIQMASMSASHYSVVDNIVTRDETWGTFPFKAVTPFVVMITVGMDDFQIRVDGMEVGRLPHYHHPLHIVDHVAIEGDGTLEQVDLVYPS